MSMVIAYWANHWGHDGWLDAHGGVWVIAGAVSEPRWAILDDPTAEDRGAADGGRGDPPNQAGLRSTVRGLAERRQS